MRQIPELLRDLNHDVIRNMRRRKRVGHSELAKFCAGVPKFDQTYVSSCQTCVG